MERKRIIIKLYKQQKRKSWKIRYYKIKEIYAYVSNKHADKIKLFPQINPNPRQGTYLIRFTIF